MPRLKDAPAAGAGKTSEAARRGLYRALWCAAASLVALILLGLAWELWLAPLRPGGSWLVLKVLPLLLPLPGILHGRLYTYRWASLLIWLYVLEALVRMLSDPTPSATLAAFALGLSLTFFVCAAAYIRLIQSYERASPYPGTASRVRPTRIGHWRARPDGKSGFKRR